MLGELVGNLDGSEVGRIQVYPHFYTVSTSPPPLESEIHSSGTVKGEDSDTTISIPIYHKACSTASYLDSKLLPKHKCLLRASGCLQLAPR